MMSDLQCIHPGPVLLESICSRCFTRMQMRLEKAEKALMRLRLIPTQYWTQGMTETFNDWQKEVLTRDVG